jgi:hypothetical protein
VANCRLEAPEKFRRLLSGSGGAAFVSSPILSLAFWSSWWGPGYFGRYAAAGPTRVRRPRVAAPAEAVEEPAAEVEEIIEER